MTTEEVAKTVQCVDEGLLRSVQEACAWLGISRPTFYLLVASGKLATLTIGRRRLVRPAELERCAASLEAETMDWRAAGGAAGASKR